MPVGNTSLDPDNKPVKSQPMKIVMLIDRDLPIGLIANTATPTAMST